MNNSADHFRVTHKNCIYCLSENDQWFCSDSGFLIVPTDLPCSSAVFGEWCDQNAAAYPLPYPMPGIYPSTTNGRTSEHD